MRTSRREFAYNTLTTLYWIAIWGTVFFAVVGIFDVDTWKTEDRGGWNAVKAVLQFTQSFQKPALAIFGIAAIVLKRLADAVGPAWLWRAIEDLLSEYRKECFKDSELTQAEFHHRVTLFQHVDLRTWWFWVTGRFWSCWRCKKPAGIRTPAAGWLVVVRRSGHATKRTNVAFLAPDDADCTEGVAGRAWGENQIVSIKELPDLSGNPTEEEINGYADETNCTIEWLKNRIAKRKYMARSITAIPIEINYRLWGVLVIDSRSPDGIKERGSGRIRDFFVVVLGKLLKQV